MQSVNSLQTTHVKAYSDRTKANAKAIWLLNVYLKIQYATFMFIDTTCKVKTFLILQSLLRIAFIQCE